MDKNEMGIELLKLFSGEFAEKQKHLWMIYFKFCIQ